MSHFSVLVVGEDVEKALAPYHEFECTGEDDEYVEEVDQTEEARTEYLREGNTTTRYKDTEGTLHNPFTPEGNHDNKFWRELTPEEDKKYGGKGGFFQDHDDNPEHGGLRLYSCDWHDGQPYHTKAFVWPSDGWSEVEVPESSTKSFAEFCEDYYGHTVVPFGTEPDYVDDHKYGYTLVDEKGEVTATIDRTNPNAKWDWFQVGGRWNGYFKLKDGTLGVIGEPGLQTMNKDYKPVTGNRADQCIKGDIDIEGMRDEAADKAGKEYDLVRGVAGDMSLHKTWKRCQEECQTGEFDEKNEPKVDYDKARKLYAAQDTVKRLRKNQDTIWFEADEFLMSREAHVANARARAIATFAVVKEGKWYERGEMGWWGLVRDEKDRDEWVMHFASLIDDLPDDTLLTVVDCHI